MVNYRVIHGSSSAGRALVSKTRCREFESLCPCKFYLHMKIISYIKESYSELVQKVSWPTRQELTNSAVVVLIASIIIALIVWLMDTGFEAIMKFVYGLLS